MLSHPSGPFSGDYISALKGCFPVKFYTPYDPRKWRNCIFSWTLGAGLPQVKLCPIFLVIYTLLRTFASDMLSTENYLL